MSNIRVRSAPSNTGPDVHLGNCRTILFNHLFAKKYGGNTLFRIEDSDTARSKDEYADNIASTLNWLGLTADEGYKIGGNHGPYMQSKKLARYKEVAEQLIERGLAYRCYCTMEELEEKRNALPEKERISFRYPGTCRDRKDQPEGKDYVVRLKAPTEGSISWKDMVFGTITVPNKENFDWVLIRSNGSILYNFGCVVDDWDQKITHVIRGRDHIVNTNIQIILHSLLGDHQIEFGHLPMMLGKDGSKLSKRHGSVSISNYKAMGYSPSAILNYLSKFGFGIDNHEIFDLKFLTEHFDIAKCKKSDGKFDPVKFAAINHEHLKSESLTPDTLYASLLKPFLNEKGISLSEEEIIPYIKVIRTRAKTFVEAAEYLHPIIVQNVNPDTALIEKSFNADSPSHLESMTQALELINDWNEQSVRSNIQAWLQNNQLTMKDFGGQVRVALLGTSVSPEIFQVITVMGKKESIIRIKDTVKLLKVSNENRNN